MPWGFAAAAVGVIGGSVISGDAAKSAAQTQANAAQSASQTELQMFNQTQSNLAPYMTSGTNALSTLNSKLPSLTAPFTAADYQQSPGYAFQMQQGTQAVSNSASAAGGIGGGNTLKALTTFGQGLANSDYQQALTNYMNQQQQTFGMYNSLAQSGQNAAANLGGIGTSVAGQVGGNTIGAGNALAAGTVGSANAVSGGVNSLAQLAALYGNGGTSSGGSLSSGTSAGLAASNNTSPSGYGNIGGYYINSDAALKKDFEPHSFHGSIQLYKFHYNDEMPTDRKHVGVIAQEILTIRPDVVKVGTHGYLTVNYRKLGIPTDEDWLELERAVEALS